MKQASIHFFRTLSLYNELNIDLFKGKTKDLTVKDIEQLIKSELIKVIEKLGSSQKLVLEEIFAIESEKVKLRNTNRRDLEDIFQKEAENNRGADRLLQFNFNEIKNKTFIQNPLIITCESYWQWTHKELEWSFFNISELLNTQKDDYYFLFVRTGTFDEQLDSNVLELPLTEFEYILQQQFEFQNTVGSVISEFQKYFNCTSKTEREELNALSEKLIREFIFKNYIVAAEK